MARYPHVLVSTIIYTDAFHDRPLRHKLDSTSLPGLSKIKLQVLYNFKLGLERYYYSTLS